MRDRFGIDHYYQIDVLVPLGDQEVQLVNDPQQVDAPVFRNTYPIHCCVLQLPPGLPDRPDVNQEVRLTGFYFSPRWIRISRLMIWPATCATGPTSATWTNSEE